MKCGSCDQTWFFNKNIDEQTKPLIDKPTKQKKILYKTENVDNSLYNAPIKPGSELVKYKPNKTAMQSGLGKIDKWILEFETKDPTKNPLMGWESSSDTYSELKLEFSTKELAIEYAKKKKINFELIEPKKRKVVKKSYADNFLN